MGHGLGSFVAVLLAVALCIAAYKLIKARRADGSIKLPGE